MFKRPFQSSLTRALAFVAGLALEGTAAAFCRTTTCNPARGDNCFSDPITKCVTDGKPVFWEGACVSFSLDTSNLPQDQVASRLEIVTQAFNAWTQPLCAEQQLAPSLTVRHEWGPVYCGQAEYNKDQGNANVIAFLDRWPYVDTAADSDELGRTTLTYEIDTGAILDADIEINKDPSYDFTITEEYPVPAGTYDLQSVLTHEVGHFMGFGHSESAQTVMRTYYNGGEDYRETRDDDKAGMCSVYEPGRPTLLCDFAPLNGFSPECALNPATGGFCAAQPPGLPTRTLDLALVSAGLGALAAWRRRRCKSASP